MSDLDDDVLSRASTPGFSSNWEQDLMIYCANKPISLDCVKCIINNMCYICVGTIPVIMHIKYSLSDPATLYVFYHDEGMACEVVDVEQVEYLYSAIERHKMHVMRPRYYCL